MTQTTRVVRLPTEIVEQAEQKRKEMIEQARRKQNNEMLAFLVGAGFGAFLGYLVAKALTQEEKGGE